MPGTIAALHTVTINIDIGLLAFPWFVSAVEAAAQETGVQAALKVHGMWTKRGTLAAHGTASNILAFGRVLDRILGHVPGQPSHWNV